MRTAAAALNLLLLPGLAWGTERLHSAVHNCCHGVVVRQALPPYSWEVNSCNFNLPPHPDPAPAPLTTPVQ